MGGRDANLCVWLLRLSNETLMYEDEGGEGDEDGDGDDRDGRG